MEISQVHLITFSPTHTSKRVGEAIAKGFANHTIEICDLTLSETKLKNPSKKDIAIFTVPVYGGHVAPLAFQRMKQINGFGMPAVVVVVYGNRDYEKALYELASFVTEHGFKVVAAGTFIGEHSYCSELNPIATGRPNDADIDFARQFGTQIKKKCDVYSSVDEIKTINVKKIPRPSQSFFSILRFVYTIIRWKKKGMVMPSSPITNTSLCTCCGRCAKVCPSGAITAENPSETTLEKCIKCCACVKECPQKARIFETPFAPLLAKFFAKPKKNKILI